VQLAFDSGTILPLVYPLLALALSCIGSLVVDYALVALERARVRWVFARFVPEQVVSEVLDCADSDLRLGGMRRECTVMFADLRGFTAFAERLDPDRVIEVLNHYLEEMSDAIMEHGGTLVAYMGDGIFSVFGAPLEQPDHADRAVSAAREMLQRLERFNAWVREEGLGDGFRIGIGLNTGEVMSGNVGSQQRLEYTAIGDTTNTASRLEAMTKGTPHQVYAAESVRSAMQDGARELEFVDELRVRGREQPIRVWTLRPAGD
jgi:adenylate cyclase